MGSHCPKRLLARCTAAPHRRAMHSAARQVLQHHSHHRQEGRSAGLQQRAASTGVRHASRAASTGVRHVSQVNIGRGEHSRAARLPHGEHRGAARFAGLTPSWPHHGSVRPGRERCRCPEAGRGVSGCVARARMQVRPISIPRSPARHAAASAQPHRRARMRAHRRPRLHTSAPPQHARSCVFQACGPLSGPHAWRAGVRRSPGELTAGEQACGQRRGHSD